LVAPVTQGAPVAAGGVVISPPYAGAVSYVSTSQSTDGCGHTALPVLPFFHANSGRAGADASSGTKICSGAPYDDGFASAGLTAEVPLPAGISGNKVVARTNLDYQLKAQIGSEQCLLKNLSFSYCDLFAQAYVSVYVYVIDETAGQYYFPTNTPTLPSAASEVYDWCESGSCGSNLSVSQHLSVTAGFTSDIKVKSGLNATHLYELVWSIEVVSDAAAYSYDANLSGTSVAGSVAMAGPGLGARLAWISVV
jgi:hypothetical protein